MPGKFRDDLEQWAWKQSLDGVEDDFGDSSEPGGKYYAYMELFVSDVEAAGDMGYDITNYAAAILSEDSDGFIEVSWYRDLETAERIWRKLQSLHV